MSLENPAEPGVPAANENDVVNTPPAASGRLLGGFLGIVALLLLGTLGWNQWTSRQDKGGGAPPAAALADPQELLRDTMRRYAAVATFQADYTWRLGEGGEPEKDADGATGGVEHDHDGDGAPDHESHGDDGDDHGEHGPGGESATPAGTSAKRTLLYARPNKFRVTSDDGGFRLTTVSDGKRLSEYTSSPTLPARNYVAPPSLASEGSLLLQHPMFCATLLHRFFGGPDDMGKLVDLSRSAVRFGPDVVVGEKACKTVRFTAQGVYGNTEVAIGKDDGLIHRIRYDSPALRQQMQEQAKGQFVPPVRTEEVYTRIVGNEPIPDSSFATDLPPEIARARAAAPPGPRRTK